MVGGYVLAPRSLVEFLDTCNFTLPFNQEIDLPAEVNRDMVELVELTNKPLLISGSVSYLGSKYQFTSVATNIKSDEGYTIYGFSVTLDAKSTIFCNIRITNAEGTVVFSMSDF